MHQQYGLKEFEVHVFRVRSLIVAELGLGKPLAGGGLVETVNMLSTYDRSESILIVSAHY